MLPLHDKDIFYRHYEQQYTANPPPGTAWYACLNAVLAIGGIISEVHNQEQGVEPGQSLLFFEESPYGGYFRNAASCFLDLTFQEPSLMAVQAMCGMVREPTM